VSRYFFTIRRRDRVEDDPEGTYLPDVAAALSYAECTIRELRSSSADGFIVADIGCVVYLDGLRIDIRNA
jgi:uncharacterized protein DUF6894